MGRPKKPEPTSEEMEVYLQQVCAAAAQSLNEVLRRPEWAGLVQFTDQEPSAEDADGRSSQDTVII